ncbi:MAG: hypothetical protein PHF56_13570 [Desulfuromonadaceae bacterium]|nr:hypothetical protein [Desulfuromonadaceae bacterium]
MVFGIEALFAGAERYGFPHATAMAFKAPPYGKYARCISLVVTVAPA